MTLGIHQLHYLPWLRYFHKIAKSDVFVLLDDIQYNKNGYQNRNKIKVATGWIYLTVPAKSHYQQKLNEIEIDNNIKWKERHYKSIQTNYYKAKYFKNYELFFSEIYQREWLKLNDLNYEILFFLIKALGIKTKILKSSELNIKGEATERLVNICKELKADTYLSGEYAGKVYLDGQFFEKEGIKVIFQEWKCPVYNQLFPKAGFIPDLSIIDLLFNEGEKSLEIINQ